MSTRTGPNLRLDAWRAARGGAKAIAARQQSRLTALVAYARAHSAFYAEHYRDIAPPVTDVRQLPPVTKPELMARFDQWVTDPAVTRAGVEAFVADLSQIGHLFLDRYTVFTTSGSSGTPAIVVHDLDAWAAYDALDIRTLPSVLRLKLKDLWQILNKPRSVALYATGGHFAGYSYLEKVRLDNPQATERNRVISILTPLPEMVQQLNAFQPAILAGYATVLALLAREQAAGRLHIHPVYIHSSAETLDPADAARIKAAFTCQLVEAYAATETPSLTFSCRFGHMHVNTDWFILEPIDEYRQPTPPGQPSHGVLVTNLANRVQPIIRYEMSDSIVLDSQPCPCGSPFPVVRVEGRTDEILTFTSPSGETVSILPLALVALVKETPGLHSFQLVQTAPARLEVRLETTTPNDEKRVFDLVKDRLAAFLTAQGLASVTIAQGTEAPRRNAHSGKLRQVYADMRVTSAVEGAAPASR